MHVCIVEHAYIYIPCNGGMSLMSPCVVRVCHGEKCAVFVCSGGRCGVCLLCVICESILLHTMYWQHGVHVSHVSINDTHCELVPAPGVLKTTLLAIGPKCVKKYQSLLLKRIKWTSGGRRGHDGEVLSDGEVLCGGEVVCVKVCVVMCDVCQLRYV